MTVRETLRQVDGHYYICTDIGVDNLENAQRNREMVANKENITAYLAVENALAGAPRNRPLPSWIPRGVLPVVKEKEWREWRDRLGGGT